MAQLFARLADIQQIAAAPAAILTNPVNKKTVVRGLWLFNGNTSLETVKVYYVTVGNAADLAHQFAEIPLQPKEALPVSFEGPGIPPLTADGDTIQAETTTASKVTVLINGDQFG